MNALGHKKSFGGVAFNGNFGFGSLKAAMGMNKVRILVVEDEMIIAEDIEFRLSSIGYQIVGIVDEVSSAVEILETKPVDIVLLDISLEGEQTGIDLAKIINLRFKLPFIFLTSNTDQVIFEAAKKVAPAAYLLKPFNDRQVCASIEMALFNFYSKPEQRDDKEAASKQKMLKDCNSLFLRKGMHFEKVNFEDILWLEAESNYTFIYTSTGKFTYSTVLKKFEERLPNTNFLRVHRSYIVNMDNITGFEGNMLLVKDKQIPVSKSIRSEVFRKFEII